MTLILLSAGNTEKFHLTLKKHWISTGAIPLWMHISEHFEKAIHIDEVIIISSGEDIAYMKHFAPYTYIQSVDNTQASLSKALHKVTTECFIVWDIAAVNISTKEIQSLQPQLTATWQTSLEQHLDFERDTCSFDTPKALQQFSCLEAPSTQTLTGFGIDTHPFEAGKKMFLCGVPIEVDYGFKAHSDGDVAIHALIDALLGAAGMGDIGELYPDTDTTYAGVDSKLLLEETVNRIYAFGYTITNIDITIMAESPKISPYKPKMRTTLATLLDIRQNFVNIKATTAEKLGFIGRKEGVTVHAVANLTYTNWTQL